MMSRLKLCLTHIASVFTNLNGQYLKVAQERPLDMEDFFGSPHKTEVGGSLVLFQLRLMKHSMSTLYGYKNLKQ